MSTTKQVTMAELMELFEITADQLPKPGNTYEQAVSIMEKFQKLIKKQYRKRVFKVHPDYGGDADEMRRMSEAYAAVMGSKPILSAPKIQLHAGYTFFLIRQSRR